MWPNGKAAYQKMGVGDPPFFWFETLEVAEEKRLRHTYQKTYRQEQRETAISHRTLKPSIRFQNI